MSEYARVYHSVVDDAKFAEVYDNDAALATWLRLLIIADQAWPASASIPASAKRRTVELLVRVGLIDTQPGWRYRVHGLDSEREDRSSSASQNAKLRWNRPKIEGGRPASRRTRFKVLERDDYRCRYCGRVAAEVAIDVDHIIPVREGGTDDLDNLVAACVDCNAGKSGHPLRAQAQSNARASGVPMPSRAEQSKAEQSTDDGRADLDAYLSVRYRPPTPAQRTLMDAYVRVFDLTGPARAARLILANPDDPIGALKADLAAFRAERAEAARKSEPPKPAPNRRASGLTGINAELAAFLREKDAQGDAA